MKNLSLQQLYNKIDKSIRLVESYTEIADLSFLFKAARLKPWCILNNDLGEINKLSLHRKWFDEFGNSIEITKKKKINITYNDLHIDRNRIICTDLYRGLSLDKIAKISKLVHIYTGSQEDNYEFFAIATFVGIDNFFRSYVYYDDQWNVCSPLLINIVRLLRICRHLDLKFFLNFKQKNNILFPCADGEEWISFMPSSENFCKILDAKYDTIFHFINS